MKVISNEKLIKRNSKLGNITSLASLAILGVGMFFSFKDKDGSYLPLTFGALIIGFLLFQLGNYYMSKWGKSPRPDERITAALKGLDDKYSLYHYATDVSHLLVGPAGMICILPYQQGGTIKYDANRDRWKQSGGNFFMKTFGGESLGKPEQEVKYTFSDATKMLKKLNFSENVIEPEIIMLFTNENVTLESEDSPVPALNLKKIKEYLRKKAKENTYSLEKITELNKAIQERI